MSQFIIKTSKLSRVLFEFGYLILALISVFTLVLTFGVSVSGLTFVSKLIAFACIVILYFVLIVVFLSLQKNQIIEVKDDTDEQPKDSIFSSDTDEKLLVLEEAGRFFGASLKPNEMYSLISSRISEILPFATCAFFQIDSRNRFFVPFAEGKNALLLESVRIECGQGIAGQAFLSKEIEYAENLQLEKSWNNNNYLNGLKSAIAIPLFREQEVFCVLVLYSDRENGFTKEDKILAEAVGERITPLINGSIAFEKSISNALTDNLTSLPNERAFYLILENQVAEAQRSFERRSLTVLAVDIKNFAKINEDYGHLVGNDILTFAAEKIREQIRDMDFLARTINDEFLIALPTAGEEITKHVIARIEDTFKENTLRISNTKTYRIELSYGTATFRTDGETAEQLIKTALLRKQHSKPHINSSVVLFPKKHVG